VIAAFAVAARKTERTTTTTLSDPATIVPPLP
jgi:hypothetical protein